MIYHVHIIYSTYLDRYYVGYTGSSKQERLRKHNLSHKGFTGRKADWVVKYSEAFETKAQAMAREKEMKNWKSRIKIQQLISPIEHPDANRGGLGLS